jgi:hypothetical protein
MWNQDLKRKRNNVCKAGTIWKRESVGEGRLKGECEKVHVVKVLYKDA